MTLSVFPPGASTAPESRRQPSRLSRAINANHRTARLVAYFTPNPSARQAVMSGSPPNYYAILEVSETATTAQIREAYKRAALKTHPDRVASDSPDRASRTRKFQLVNDAYFTLSDATRRRDYDAQRKLFTPPAAGADAFAEADEQDGVPRGGPAGGPFSWAWNYFSGRQGGAAGAGSREEAESAQFSNVFEEMMREEGMAEEGTNRPTNKFWSIVGGVSGGALGFIVANVPGMIAGAVGGNRLGAVRDAKGKSVYAVFQDLPQADRARLLSQLASKVFSHVTGI
ncbi:hypothetical protein E4U44_001760 [Claviceps purpurea]|nr:hypothetical protein E4U44_001760 [Claviceps purpurea]